jgi:8-oxo-dGTP pyrophosphatase MutT (NUDIX family)
LYAKIFYEVDQRKIRQPLKLVMIAVASDNFWVEAGEKKAVGGGLSFNLDSYGGVVVDTNSLPDSAEVFAEGLKASVTGFVESGFKRTIWLRIPQQKACLIPVAVGEGFDFYHCIAGESMMMTKWFDVSRPSPLPLPPFHNVGVGAFIISDIKHTTSSLILPHVLLVQECSGPASRRRLWKMVTGLVNPKESIPTAALREAVEETGLAEETLSFDCVLAIRHHSFGGSPCMGRPGDVLFVCVLKHRVDLQNGHESISSLSEKERPSDEIEKSK